MNALLSMLRKRLLAEAQEVVLVESPRKQESSCTQKPNSMCKSQKVVYRLTGSERQRNTSKNINAIGGWIENRNVRMLPVVWHDVKLPVCRFQVEASAYQ